jgi:hypothetical protein
MNMGEIFGIPVLKLLQIFAVPITLGRVYDAQRGAWVACERCSGTGRVVVYLYPKLKRRS